MDELTDVGASVNTEAAPSLLDKIKKTFSYRTKHKGFRKNLKAPEGQLGVKRNTASRFSDDTKLNMRGFMEFESRLIVLNGVLEALKDENVSMCSICGLGGSGKTTLAKTLIQRVEADRLFSNVSMVTISQNPHFESVREAIVESLGLKIDEESMAGRAKKLKDWLSNNSTLLVLDDVWWELSEEDFKNVGIPLGSKRCKIVLTSRNEDECKKMGSQRNFCLHALENEEAWDLFRQTAGKCVEELNLEDTARKIVDECGGLPIAIVTIARALRDTPMPVWEDSLRKLQNSNLPHISGMEKMYSRIQLSYDLLNDEEAQACFRLFCLFPEDSDVSAEQLAIYMKGLGLLEDADSITDARNRVEAITNKLIKSFLLLDGEEDGCFKMHDIVRDTALFITSHASDPFLVQHEKEMVRWPETHHYEICNAISFKFDKVKEHPVDLSCPKLELLMLSLGDGSTGLPAGIFDTMTKLRVLILHVPSLLQPLVMLKELRALIICETSNYWDEREPHKIGDLLGQGVLKNLGSFSLISERPCHDFPEEIGLLCSLRFLHLDLVPFEYLKPGVLSKLKKLEELQLPREFMSWGCKEENGERVNASLDEIELLPLTRLKIGMKEGASLGDQFVKKLKVFELFVGRDKYDYQPKLEESRAALDVVGVDASAGSVSWMISMESLERLKLVYVRNLKNLMLLSKSVKMKKIEILCCEDIECLFDTTAPAPCFSNLGHLTIIDCSKLKYMFPFSVAGQLINLKSIKIEKCHEMEEIFCRENRNQIVGEHGAKEDDGIMFPQLKKLELNRNHKLRVFYGGNEAIKLLFVEEITIGHCPNMEALSRGSLYAPKLEYLVVNDIDSCLENGVEDLNSIFKQLKPSREPQRDAGGRQLGTHETEINRVVLKLKQHIEQANGRIMESKAQIKQANERIEQASEEIKQANENLDTLLRCVVGRVPSPSSSPQLDDVSAPQLSPFQSRERGDGLSAFTTTSARVTPKMAGGRWFKK